jgi:SWI/SNF-related matrix-associated actin-dependent regulator 1 of chromatin subfamily A
VQQEFKFIICDESHYLKSGNAGRTQLILPLLKAAKHKLLLSGTPALSRPAELYTQLDALGTPIFKSFHQFGLR